MKAAGCNVFVNTAIPKFAAQSIKKAAEIEWKPLHILSSIGSSVAATLKPAGLDISKGIVSDFYLKDPTDPEWKDDAGYKWWVGFMDKYYPERRQDRRQQRLWSVQCGDGRAGAEAVRR